MPRRSFWRYGLNSSGWTPKALTIEYLKVHNIEKLNPIGADTITVPGCVAGWEALRTHFGTKPFAKLLSPAIFYAENGFPLAEKNARYWVAISFIESARISGDVFAGRRCSRFR